MKSSSSQAFAFPHTLSCFNESECVREGMCERESAYLRRERKPCEIVWVSYRVCSEGTERGLEGAMRGNEA